MTDSCSLWTMCS